MSTKTELEAELKEVEAKINDAYWAFTRQANAKPPSLVVPEAYTRRKEIRDELRRLRRDSQRRPDGS